ncbi:DUF4326 domain-containing protein [Micromonospora aurantiaca (nom. illeg.)]|uniref:DUF4326 domain-containing protein n=1 Tax=Micromonospora aurantiaca (nom. illeg.) TaxID=47850 RepID=UPI000828FAB5|nr:DUF4326 domain-containing protein [Micromonospora aurantiaca]SCL21250.1 protein of unknown function [Micromonospora aurantiaca]SCL21385.1 protein of unknown function [Micromonospora aurantiaca]
MSRRIQRRRTAGWQMPPGAVYIGRPSRWGNPYRGAESERAAAVQAYAQLLDRRPDLVAAARAALAGRTLVCWCPVTKPCHGDILVAVVDGLSPLDAARRLFPLG